jgi:D-tagatose 6-phosphate 4-epimerase
LIDMLDSNHFPLVLERLTGDPKASGGRVALPSICTAHTAVLQITLDHAAYNNEPVLIEATCNQVNQDGGYTGMTPLAFYGQILALAEQAGLDPRRLILGGDHLGPNPWKHLPASEAMEKAEVMIAAYVRAGFRKLHLDTSMGCADEPQALDDTIVAERAAQLAAVAERVTREEELPSPLYIVGTEVPPPGGAFTGAGHLAVTDPAAALRTMEIHRQEFRRKGLGAAMERVIGLVVQPGVEFGDEGIDIYEPEKAQRLAAVLPKLSGAIFEAHSTDYQPPERLRSLAKDGFGILKVGPALTFAWREAIYGLDQILAVLADGPPFVASEMEAVMLEQPNYWKPYYHGAADEVRMRRHFSYSDRIRYYWPTPRAKKAIVALLEGLGHRSIPQTLISQFMARHYEDVVAGSVKPTASGLIAASVQAVLNTYRQASIRD